jgi:hypothetical protein
VRPVHLHKVARLSGGRQCPVTGAVTGRFGCAWMPCSWLSGAVAERARGAVSVAYVLQDLLTTTDVRTRMAQLGFNSERALGEAIEDVARLGAA